MSLNINTAVPWIIITSSFMATLALHASYAVKTGSLGIVIFM